MAGRITRHNQGQALLEYALVLLFIALVVLVSLAALGPTLLGFFNRAVVGFP